MANEKSNSIEVIISEEGVNRILELMKKYKLEEVEGEIYKKMGQADDISLREKLFEDLPLRRISRIVKGVVREEISIEKLPSVLQEKLNLSEELAKNLSQELKQKVIPLAEIISGEIVSTEKEKVFIQKKKFLEEVSEKKIEEEIKPKKRDIYQEPIE